MAKSVTEFSLVCRSHCEKTVVVIGEKAPVCLRVAFVIKRVILLLTLSFDPNILYSIERYSVQQRARQTKVRSMQVFFVFQIEPTRSKLNFLMYAKNQWKICFTQKILLVIF